MKEHELIRLMRFLMVLMLLVHVSGDVFCDRRRPSDERRYPFALIVERTPGRLGDQLIMYTKQKWACWKYGGKLLHVTFPQSSLFVLDKKEERYKPRYHSGIYKKHSGVLNGVSHLTLNTPTPRLYTLGFSFHDDTMIYDLFNNTEFRDVIRTSLEPTVPVPVIALPTNGVTVALHVRKGGSYDGKLLSNQFFVSPPYVLASDDFFQKIPCPVGKPSSFIDENWPLRFLPDQFYVDQISILAAMLPHETIYVHLFTDASNPESLIVEYKRELKQYSNVIITTPSEGEHERLEQYASGGMIIDYRNDEEYNIQLLSELFCMARCDVLIRGSSGVSLMAEILGNHLLVVTPAKYHWNDKTLIMDTLTVRGADKKLVKNYSESLLMHNT